MLICKPRLKNKDLYVSLGFVGVMAVVAIICNSLFRALFSWEPNYFYLFNYEGTPLKFLYDAFSPSVYGWFEINWFYTLTLIAVFMGVFVGLYYLVKLAVNKIK